MQYLNAESILDDALTLVQDNTAKLRSKFLVWLNLVQGEVALQRTWWSLFKEDTLTPASNKITLPSDFDEYLWFKAADGSGFFLEERHHLTDEQAYDIADPDAVDPDPAGFTISTDKTEAEFFPGVSEDVKIKYYPTIADLTDDDTDSVWPIWFKNLFVRGVLDMYYEYDMDERKMVSPRLRKDELKKCKTKDNRHKPPQSQNLNYLRQR